MARVPLRLLYAGLLLQSAAALEPSEQKPIIEGVENVEDVAQSGPGGTPGKIVLYPGSRTFPSDLKAMNMEVKACPRDSSPKTIELSPDVCLSGEYYVQNNMKFVETPKCADGTEASMMFYPNRGCTGTPRFSSSETPFAMGDCLWSEEQNPVPSYYWSIIYRCNTETDEGVSHETAEPPSLVGEIIGPRRAIASFHNGPPFQCHTDFANKSHAWEYSPDECSWPVSLWPHEALEIRTPAICANGTRAQLAIYEDFGKNWRNYKCIESKRVPHTRRIDIDDSMINTCIDIKHKTYPNRAIGVQFYCNGLEYENGVGKPIIPEKEPPVPKAGMVSHNVCATSAGRWQWNAAEGHPTFFYPKAETCIKLPKSHQVKPYKNAICPDGSAARFTEWSNADCSGWPASIEGVDASMFLNCQNWNLAGESSYMFWCGTNGTEPSEKSSDDHRAVVTRNGCPKEEKDKGWVGRKDEVGPTYERIEPDTCVNLGKSSRWLVFSGATCKDGSTAKVALWKRNACFGKPDSITRFEESGIGECKQTCPDDSWSCSMAFWCEGIERDGIF